MFGLHIIQQLQLPCYSHAKRALCFLCLIGHSCGPSNSPEHSLLLSDSSSLGRQHQKTSRLCGRSLSSSLVRNEVLWIDTRVVVDHDLPKTFESFAGVHHKGVMVDGFSSISTRNLCKFTPAPVQENCLPSLTILHGTFIPRQATCVQRLPTRCPDSKCKAQTFLGQLANNNPGKIWWMVCIPSTCTE